MNSLSSISKEDKVTYLKAGAMVLVVLVIFGAWLWWQGVYTSKDDVFKAMLSNSLSTRGVTKTITQENEGGSVTQKAQAQYGAQNVVQVKTEINQKSEEGDTKVVTNTIATPSENFVRYTEIKTPQDAEKKLDFSALVNQWGKQVKAEGGASVFSEATLGIVLFGNLPADKRNELLAMMPDDRVYKVDYSTVESQNLDGRSVYKYNVEIQTQKYVELLKKYDEMLGIGFTNDLNPEDYAGAPPVKATMYVDKLSRTLAKLEYQEGARSEIFSAYGIQSDVEIPEQAIGQTELEQKLQNILAQ